MDRTSQLTVHPRRAGRPFPDKLKTHQPFFMLRMSTGMGVNLLYAEMALKEPSEDLWTRFSALVLSPNQETDQLDRVIDSICFQLGYAVASATAQLPLAFTDQAGHVASAPGQPVIGGRPGDGQL